MYFQVFVPQRMGHKVKHIFDILSNGVSSVKAKERSQEIQHLLLTGGNVNEVRFVLGKIITKTLLHSKKLAQGAVAEAEMDDLHVTNPPPKLNLAEQTENTSGHLRKLFTLNKRGAQHHQITRNEKKRSTTPSNHEESPDNATKKARLSEDNTTTGTGSRLSEFMKDEHVKAETRSNRSVVSGLSK